MRPLSHYYQSWPRHLSLPPWNQSVLAKLSSSSDNMVSLMGPGTGQKLRPLGSKDVSLSVSWWLERLTTVWELLSITRDLRLKCLLRLFFCLSIEFAGWCEKPFRWNLLRCRLLRAKLCIAVMSSRRFEMFSYSETNRSFFYIYLKENETLLSIF